MKMIVKLMDVPLAIEARLLQFLADEQEEGFQQLKAKESELVGRWVRQKTKHDEGASSIDLQFMKPVPDDMGFLTWAPTSDIAKASSVALQRLLDAVGIFPAAPPESGLTQEQILLVMRDLMDDLMPFWVKAQTDPEEGWMFLDTMEDRRGDIPKSSEVRAMLAVLVAKLPVPLSGRALEFTAKVEETIIRLNGKK